MRPQVQEFWKTLQSLGYVLGKNLDVDIREARGDAAKLPSLAADLVTRAIRFETMLWSPQTADVTKDSGTITSVISLSWMA
jgi:hypothetical protein